MGPLRPGHGVHGKVQKKMFWKIKFWSKKKFFFFWTVNQLKKTSDCIKIDPPGPGQNLEKNQKSQKIIQNFGTQKKFFFKKKGLGNKTH